MTTEELEQIRKIIREEITAETEPIKRDMATKQDIQRVEQTMERDAEEIAGFFHKTWEKMDETNERVTTIEDHLELPHPTENN